MSQQKDYEERTKDILGPMVERRNFELVDVEYVNEGGNNYLRAYIDKPGGITIDDLEEISRELGEKLDENDFISDPYTLEVGSPGIDRPIKKDSDFERNLGRKVEVRLYKSYNKKKYYEGIIDSYDKDFVVIDDGDKKMEFRRADIALIRQTIEF